MLCKSSLIWANSYTLYQIISWIYLFQSDVSCFISKPKPKTKINTIKTKTMSKPIPKLAKPYQNQNYVQSQYQNWQNHIKTNIQDQNSKTSIGFGA